ncbi:hypothetical protein [Bradyrhizobium sp. B120]|uniref:hypothetical protein n=1 Tax=Bradyrhizobium sp. B120 TaxID=3410088 RepID=UPI003B981355
MSLLGAAEALLGDGSPFAGAPIPEFALLFALASCSTQHELDLDAVLMLFLEEQMEKGEITNAVVGHSNELEQIERPEQITTLARMRKTVKLLALMIHRILCPVGANHRDRRNSAESTQQKTHLCISSEESLENSQQPP